MKCCIESVIQAEYTDIRGTGGIQAIWHGAVDWYTFLYRVNERQKEGEPRSYESKQGFKPRLLVRLKRLVKTMSEQELPIRWNEPDFMQSRGKRRSHFKMSNWSSKFDLWSICYSMLLPATPFLMFSH